jgi:hypothetical protein
VSNAQVLAYDAPVINAVAPSAGNTQGSRCSAAVFCGVPGADCAAWQAAPRWRWSASTSAFPPRKRRRRRRHRWRHARLVNARVLCRVTIGGIACSNPVRTAHFNVTCTLPAGQGACMRSCPPSARARLTAATAPRAHTGANKTLVVTASGQTGSALFRWGGGRARALSLTGQTARSYAPPAVFNVTPATSDTDGGVPVVVAGSNFGTSGTAPAGTGDAQEADGVRRRERLHRRAAVLPDHRRLDAHQHYLPRSGRYPQARPRAWVCSGSPRVLSGQGTLQTVQVITESQNSNTNVTFSYNAPVINGVTPLNGARRAFGRLCSLTHACPQAPPRADCP